MRLRISVAALLVKVSAIISSGSSTVANSFKYRCVSSSVLPAPAGASTINDSSSKARMRFAASCALRSIMDSTPRPLKPLVCAQTAISARVNVTKV